jgi:hypothetical protein
MVAEISTIAYQERHCDAVGRLILCRREAFIHDVRRIGAQSEVAWYILTLDAKVYRWCNAAFIRVLDDPMGETERRAWAVTFLGIYQVTIDEYARCVEWIRKPLEVEEVIVIGGFGGVI